MAGELGKVSLEVETNISKAEAGLKSFENKVKQTAANVQNIGGAAGSSFVDKFAKGFAALGAIEGAFKGLTAVAKAFKGDMDGALDALGSLPMGIGPAISSIRGFIDVLNGSTEAADRLKQALKDAKSEMAFRDELEEVQFQDSLVGKSDDEKAKMIYERKNKQINEDFRRGSMPPNIDPSKKAKFSFSGEEEIDAIEASKYGFDRIQNEIAEINKSKKEETEEFNKAKTKGFGPGTKYYKGRLISDWEKGITGQDKKMAILEEARARNTQMEVSKMQLLEAEEDNRKKGVVDKTLETFFNEIEDQVDAEAKAAEERIDYLKRLMAEEARILQEDEDIWSPAAEKEARGRLDEALKDFFDKVADEAEKEADKLRAIDDALANFFDDVEKGPDDKKSVFKDITLSLQALSFEQQAMTPQKVIDEEAKEQRRGMLLYLQNISRARAEAGLA